jgi:hypothetical protein
MPDPVAAVTAGTSEPDHDHAWRRTEKGSDWPGELGVYCCDLCPATWSM